jgi:hypothetical protein
VAVLDTEGTLVAIAAVAKEQQLVPVKVLV